MVVIYHNMSQTCAILLNPKQKNLNKLAYPSELRFA